MSTRYWMSIVAVVVGCLALALPASHAEEPIARVTWEANADKAWDASKSSGRPLLLFVTSEGCVYCEQMERMSYSDRNVASTIRQSYVASKIQAEQQPGLVRKLGLKLYPTTVIISPDAKVIETIDGYVEPIVLQQRLAAALGKKPIR